MFKFVKNNGMSVFQHILIISLAFLSWGILIGVPTAALIFYIVG